MTTRCGPEVPSLLPEAEPCPKSFSLGITGEVHGAGSTTTAKMLAEILEFSYEYAGDYRRRLAVRVGYATDFEDDAGVARFDEIASEHPQTDARLDKRVITNAVKGNCVFEGKAAIVLAKAGQSPVRNPERKKWVLSPIKSPTQIYTVLLRCDERTAAQRILLRKTLSQQGKDPFATSYEERQEVFNQLTQGEINTQMETSQKRMATNRQNWNNFYNLSGLEKGEGAYDLTIDATCLTPEKVVGKILAALACHEKISPLLSEEVLTLKDLWLF